MGARSAAAHSSAHPARSPRRAASDGVELGQRAPLRLTPEIETELSAIAAAAGCELLHVEWKGGVLRLVLDREPGQATTAPDPSERTTPPAPPAPPEDPRAAADSPSVTAPAAPPEPAEPAAPPEVTASGVSLGDCEHVARQASALLDVLDFGKGRYLLEVSSPGLDRQLYGPRDYRRFLGRLARVTYEVAGARRTVVARLAEFHPPATAGLPDPPAPLARLARLARPAAGPRALPGAGEVTLIDERTGERLALALENIRQARLEVEL